MAEALLDRSAGFRTLAEPAVQIALNEFVVLKIRVAGAYSIYLLELPGRKILFRIETPTPGEEPLTSQDFMQARQCSRQTDLRASNNAAFASVSEAERARISSAPRPSFRHF